MAETVAEIVAGGVAVPKRIDDGLAVRGGRKAGVLAARDLGRRFEPEDAGNRPRQPDKISAGFLAPRLSGFWPLGAVRQGPSCRAEAPGDTAGRPSRLPCGSGRPWRFEYETGGAMLRVAMPR